MRNIRKTSKAIQHQDTWVDCKQATIRKVIIKIAIAFLLLAIFSVFFVSCDDSTQQSTQQSTQRIRALEQEIQQRIEIIQQRNEIIHQQEIIKYIIIMIAVIGFFIGVGIGSKALKDSRKNRQSAKGDTHEQE
jgi:amino acid permease